MTASHPPSALPGDESAWSGFWAQAAILMVVYAMAHVLLLVDRGVYWDDWNFVHADPAALDRHLDQMGVPFLAGLHHVLLATTHPLAAYRILTFVCYLVAALCTLRIMRVTPGVSAMQALVVATIAATLPLNAARVSLCCAHYAVCNALLFIGFALLTFDGSRSGALARIAAMAAFVLSFSTTSIIGFFPVVMMHRYLRLNGLVFERSRMLRFAAMHADLLLLPIVYLAVRFIWFQPNGEYLGYNKITAKGLLNIGDVAKALTIFFFGGGKLVPKRPEVLWLIPPLWLGVTWALGRWSPWRADRRHLVLAGIGLLAMLLAIYPYVAVGKVPAPWDWDSRHELLLPFGAAIFVCFVSRLWFDAVRMSGRVATILTMAFIASLVARDSLSYLDYQRDWHKQKALISAFRANDEIRSHTSFVVYDHAGGMNARGRQYRFYEWTGLMRAAYGDQTRYAADATVPPVAAKDLPTARDIYGIDEYVFAKPQRIITVSPLASPGYAATFLAMIWSWSDRPRFDSYVRGLLDAQCEMLSGGSAASRDP